MGLFVRTVGIRREEMKIGRTNLVYNIWRFPYLKRVNARIIRLPPKNPVFRSIQCCAAITDHFAKSASAEQNVA